MLRDLRGRLFHRLAMHVPTRPFRMKSDQPLVTFTFDDVPSSALTTGTALLDAYGAKGTFYIATGLLSQQDEHWINLGPDGVLALHRDGHEIGCHTHGHRRVCDVDLDGFASDIRRNRQELLAIEPSLALENFAFPFGWGSPGSKRELASLFRSSRSIVPGVNKGLIDLQFLRSSPLLDITIDRAGIETLLDEAMAANGWLIFYTHDVETDPSPYGCSPALLDHALRLAQQRGIRSVTLSEGLDLIGAPGSAAVNAGVRATS